MQKTTLILLPGERLTGLKYQDRKTFPPVRFTRRVSILWPKRRWQPVFFLYKIQSADFSFDILSFCKPRIHWMWSFFWCGRFLHSVRASDVIYWTTVVEIMSKTSQKKVLQGSGESGHEWVKQTQDFHPGDWSSCPEWNQSKRWPIFIRLFVNATFFSYFLP